MDQKISFEINDYFSYTTSSYAEFTVLIIHCVHYKPEVDIADTEAWPVAVVVMASKISISQQNKWPIAFFSVSNLSASPKPDFTKTEPQIPQTPKPD